MKPNNFNLSHLPLKPGVYLFRNKNNEVIYIGKAVNLRRRIKSYFTKTPKDPKIKKMISAIKKIDYLTTNSEFQALLLEAKLINQYQPRFNTRHKDDKHYLYLAIFKDPFPHLNIVRRVDLEEKIWAWFGPFPSSKTVKEIIRLLRRIFPFCTCRSLPQRQCFFFHLNLCPGKDNLFHPSHWQNIKQVKRILEGKTSLVTKILERKMKEAAKKLEFEKANFYKKQLLALTAITEGKKPLSGNLPIKKALLRLRKILVQWQKFDPQVIEKIEGYDVANLGEKIIVGAMVVFQEEELKKPLYRHFKIKSPSFLKQNDPAALKQIICRRFNHPEWLYPQVILVDGGKPQVTAAFTALKEKEQEKKVGLLGLAKKKEVLVIPQIKKGKITSWKLLKLSPSSPLLRLLQQIRDEAHRFAQRYYRTLYRKKTFSL